MRIITCLYIFFTVLMVKRILLNFFILYILIHIIKQSRMYICITSFFKTLYEKLYVWYIIYSSIILRIGLLIYSITVNCYISSSSIAYAAYDDYEDEDNPNHTPKNFFSSVRSFFHNPFEFAKTHPWVLGTATVFALGIVGFMFNIYGSDVGNVDLPAPERPQKPARMPFSGQLEPLWRFCGDRFLTNPRPPYNCSAVIPYNSVDNTSNRFMDEMFAMRGKYGRIRLRTSDSQSDELYNLKDAHLTTDPRYPGWIVHNRYHHFYPFFNNILAGRPADYDAGGLYSDPDRLPGSIRIEQFPVGYINDLEIYKVNKLQIKTNILIQLFDEKDPKSKNQMAVRASLLSNVILVKMHVLEEMTKTIRLYNTDPDMWRERLSNRTSIVYGHLLLPEQLFRMKYYSAVYLNAFNLFKMLMECRLRMYGGYAENRHGHFYGPGILTITDFVSFLDRLNITGDDNEDIFNLLMNDKEGYRVFFEDVKKMSPDAFFEMAKTDFESLPKWKQQIY